MESSTLSLFDQVNEALDTIRPYLKKDGGDVELIEITNEGVAVVKLLGSCSSCEMSHMTMKAGLEEGIKKAVPSIRSVMQVQA